MTSTLSELRRDKMNQQTETQREELINICERAAIKQDKWRDRDSAQAQIQIGAAWVLLKAGCEYQICTKENRKRIYTSCITNDKTIWLEITYKGFAYKEDGETLSVDIYYLPTHKRLEECGQNDWY